MNQDYGLINVEEEEKDPSSVLNFYRKLIAVRKESDTLIYGDFTLLEEDDEDLFVYQRTMGDEKYRIIVNMSGKEREYQCKGKVVLSNYSDFLPYLRAWEAKVIKEVKLWIFYHSERFFSTFSLIRLPWEELLSMLLAI